MNPFKGQHFQRDIILWAVRWYCKYGISYRELQEMLALLPDVCSSAPAANGSPQTGYSPGDSLSTRASV